MEAAKEKAPRRKSRSRSSSRENGTSPGLEPPPAPPSLNEFSGGAEEEGPQIILVGQQSLPEPPSPTALLSPLPTPPPASIATPHATPALPTAPVSPPPYSVEAESKPPIIPAPDSAVGTSEDHAMALPSTSSSVVENVEPSTPPSTPPPPMSLTPSAPEKEGEEVPTSPSLSASGSTSTAGKKKRVVRTLVATHDAGLGVDAESTLKAVHANATTRRWVWYANRQHVEALDVNSFITTRHFPTDQKSAMFPGNSAIAALVHNEKMVFAAAGESVWAKPVNRPEDDLTWENLWEMKIGGWGPHGLSLDGKTLYVACRTPGEKASQKHIVAALEAETGDMKWAAQFPDKQQDWGYPLDAVSRPDVVLVGQSGQLSALTKDSGKIIWTTKFKGTGSYPPTWVMTPLPPSVATEQPPAILLVSSGRYLYRVNPDTGDILEYAYKGGVVLTNSPSSLVYHPARPDVVYVRDGSTHKLHCMKVNQPFGAKDLWSWTSKAPRGDSATYESGGAMYIEKPTSYFNGEVTCLYERQGWTRFFKSKLTIRRFVLQGKRISAFFPGQNQLRRSMLISDAADGLELSPDGKILTLRGSSFSETKEMVLHFDSAQNAEKWANTVRASVGGAAPTPHIGSDVIVENGVGILRGVDPDTGIELWRNKQIWSPSAPGFPMMGMRYDAPSGLLLLNSGYKIRGIDPMTGAQLAIVSLDKPPADENTSAPFSQPGNEATSSQPFAHAQFTERMSL